MTDGDTLEVLERGSIDIAGRLTTASNATFLATAELDGCSVRCVYKPIRGERPLWDFPTGTLAGREVAAYLVSDACGWGVVPPTAFGSGPYGTGMVQEWVEESDDGQVDLVPEGEVPDGWRHVLDAYDASDRPVSLVHADNADLRRMSLFDVVINNADRKGGHVLTTSSGELFGCDHGVSFHVANKLRTVLWGWAGEPLSGAERELVVRSREQIAGEPTATRLLELLTADEVASILRRLRLLLAEGAFPEPGEHWPSIPWPAF